MNESEIQEKIQIVIRQTDYSVDEARQQLKNHDFNIIKTITSFMNPKKREEENIKKKSVNQEIYSQIRNYLDNGVVDKTKQRIYYEDFERSKTREIEFTMSSENNVVISSNKSNDVDIKKEEAIKKEEDNNENKVINI